MTTTTSCWVIWKKHETHCHLKKDETKWSGEWEGKWFWSKGTSRSKGVAILFKPGFKSDIVKANTDSNGRYIIIYVKRGEVIYRIVNIYAWNEEYERINFINMMIQILSEDCNDNMETIIGGYYNCVLNTVETIYSTIYHSKYFIELNIDKSTQYVALWTHKRHPVPRPFGRAMECLLWVLQQKLIVL